MATQRYKAQMILFEPDSKLQTLTEVPMHPKTGFRYIFKWEEKANRQDWRSDGYRWRQNSTVTFSYDDQTCKRYYFKLHIAPGECTTEFTRHAIESPLYPKQVLVWYQGDDSVVVDYSRANCKKKKNLEDTKLAINQDHSYLDCPNELDCLLDETLKDTRQDVEMTPRFKAQMRLFDAEAALPIHTEVPIRPKTGFKYIYKWEDSSKHQDWRADGYRWRQNSTATFNYGGVKCRRYYFKLQIKPGGECTTEFTRHAIECPLYDKQVLVWYQGDDSVVVDFAHGNSKDPTKEFHRTAPSVLKKMKSEKEKLPLQVYSDLVHSAPSEVERHIIDAPRDIKQVRNARKIALKANRSSLDAVFNLVGFRSEAGLVSDIHLTPFLEIVFYNENAITELKRLLAQENLPSQGLSYEMGFEIEDVYLAVLSYRHTEFEETPIIPLLFLLYDRDSPSVHDFFFLRVTELIPELLTARKAIIVSNEEPAVVEALEKNLPELPRFRCWFHALQTIRSKLQILEIEDRQEVQQYESDYLRLLNQASAGDYKTALGQMYLKKWKKEFSDFFDLEIDAHMERMGRWKLRSLGVSFQSAKQSELFNAIKKQFVASSNCRKYSVDKVVVVLLGIAEYFNVKVARSRLGKGDYTLREHLIDPKSKVQTGIPEPLTIEQAIIRVKKARVGTRSETMRRISAQNKSQNDEEQRGTKRPLTDVDSDTNEAENSINSIEQQVVVEEIELEEGTVHYVIEGEDVTIENEMTIGSDDNGENIVMVVVEEGDIAF